ncbi:gephyrin-like molybdotransferase receptor GlpR [Streptomyces sp. NPDC059740]|uniref:divisome protein SepX/GlpR n=1 Tax=Streptomyces sp. NPDC059740 TaxID=3346926 RepID=UPI003648C422
MSSSGLIYAVIVGAWAAYLVPMWLRRQDELNEARPTERFSTAIRLLSGRAAMERRYAKGQGGRALGDDAADPESPDTSATTVEAGPLALPRAGQSHVPEPHEADRAAARPAPRSTGPRSPLAERAARAKVLARRRRTITVLFLVFTAGAVVAGVGGVTFLWAPAVPALLLSAYIVYLRSQERRRFAFVMDQRQAEAAARRLRESRRSSRPSAPAAGAEEGAADARVDAPAETSQGHSTGTGRNHRAVVEETDHAEWVDQQRASSRPEPEGWDPVPVPLPTYVTAPVAPRATGHVDLDADDAWSSARSSAAADPTPRPAPRRSRHRTPLFDQYANPARDPGADPAEDLDRPRAANE